MSTLYTQQDVNVKKTWLLMSGFFIFVIFLGWGVSFLYEAPEILYFAVIFSVGMNLFSYYKSDKIALAVTKAKPASEENYLELHRMTENLCISAGIKKPRLYIINDPAPNAFATGRNQDNAAVAVTTGLLEMLDRTELEGVIAHELAHIGNRDILLQTIVVILVGFITLIADIFIRSNLMNGKGDSKNAGYLFLIGIVLAILSPLVATMIQLAISRKREFLADATGALITRYPEGLASALEKISTYTSPIRSKNHATAHLFIASPFGGKNPQKKVSFMDKIFSTHPPVQERINALRGLK
jgi:heat shock protein HtpX